MFKKRGQINLLQRKLDRAKANQRNIIQQLTVGWLLGCLGMQSVLLLVVVAACYGFGMTIAFFTSSSSSVAGAAAGLAR